MNPPKVYFLDMLDVRRKEMELLQSFFQKSTKPMKKYRLIQKYPGSPFVGAEVHKKPTGHYTMVSATGINVRYFDPYEIEDQPKFWAEVVETTGTILFTDVNGSVTRSHKFTFDGTKDEFIRRVNNFNVKAENGCDAARPVTQGSYKERI